MVLLLTAVWAAAVIAIVVQGPDDG
jgi:hypothetical protein